MGDPLVAGVARPSVVTIGNFDGVHVGHRMLIATAMRLAAQSGRRSVVLTFDRHPATVVRPDSAPLLLTDPRDKLELLRASGVDDVSVLVFDERRAAEPAEDFVRSVIVGQLAARAVVVGSNFRFGHRQLGDVELLGKLGDELGFAVTAIDLVADDDLATPVSSSGIRQLVRDGELEHAAQLLGRPHQVRATVSAVGRAEVVPGLLLPPPGDYEASIGPMGSPGSPSRLRLAGQVIASPAVDAVAGEELLVQFQVRISGDDR